MEFAERTTIMVWDILIAAGINMALNFVFIPRFGYVAAAYTTLVSYAVYVILIWWQARRLIPWDIAYFKVLVTSIAAVLSWAVGETTMKITDISIFKLIIGAFGFICTYGLVNLVLRHREMATVSLWRTIR
jgi:O-antigen/teichoic acid export membrane protein